MDTEPAGTPSGSQASSARRPTGDPAKIRLISLGGTIAMGASAAGGVAHSLDAADLVGGLAGELAAANGSDEATEVDCLTLRRLPGWQLTLADVVQLAGEIERSFAEGFTGAVVTQGTDTIEETAFLLELLGCAAAGPVVVTGAMRNPTLPGADGPANLLAAMSTAACDEARGLGVLVVVNDEIHAARLVSKRHTTSPAAFVSHPGALGWLSEGRPVIVLRPRGEVTVPGALGALRAAAAPEVALARGWLGDDGRLFARLGELGYAGLVVEAFGGGHVTAKAAARLEEVAVQMPVVIASRSGAGAVLHATYAGEGGELDLRRRGLFTAGWLPGLKARLVLLALLATDATREEIEGAFARFA
jgi:L-asparaginase